MVAMMADLAVTSGYLDTLAQLQDQAAETAGSAETATSGIGKNLWLTHGVVSSITNIAVDKAEAVRRTVGEAMKHASTGLAAKLRTASTAYDHTDEQAGLTIDGQVITR